MNASSTSEPNASYACEASNPCIDVFGFDAEALNCIASAMQAATVHGAGKLTLDHVFYAALAMPGAREHCSTQGMDLTQLRRDLGLKITSDERGFARDSLKSETVSIAVCTDLRGVLAKLRRELAGQDRSAVTFSDLFFALAKSSTVASLDRYHEAGRAQQPAPHQDHHFERTPGLDSRPTDRTETSHAKVSNAYTRENRNTRTRTQPPGEEMADRETLGTILSAIREQGDRLSILEERIRTVSTWPDHTPERASRSANTVSRHDGDAWSRQRSHSRSASDYSAEASASTNQSTRRETSDTTRLTGTSQGSRSFAQHHKTDQHRAERAVSNRTAGRNEQQDNADAETGRSRTRDRDTGTISTRSTREASARTHTAQSSSDRTARDTDYAQERRDRAWADRQWSRQINGSGSQDRTRTLHAASDRSTRAHLVNNHTSDTARDQREASNHTHRAWPDAKTTNSSRSTERHDEATEVADKRFYLSIDDDVVDGPSIGPKTAARLYPVGINTVRDLLLVNVEDAARAIDARHITPDVLKDWQDQARLVCTIPWLRGTHAQLLVGSGFRTVEAITDARDGDILSCIQAFATTRSGERILRNAPPPPSEKITTWIENAEQAERARVT
ncbi:MAG: DUF4332 domain-containing protein [Pseudomonadota bacterium]